jgi:type I restriction enzyme S subunit
MSSIPDGWRQGRFEDFVYLQRGFDITENQAVEGNVPVISSSGRSYFHNEAKAAPPGVVIGRKGKLGQVYFVDVPFWPHDTTLWVKDFRGNSPEFVAIFLDHMQLDRLDAATSVPTLNRNNVHALQVTFPPLSEQHKIAEILGTWDAAIARVEQLIAALQLRKKGMMQRLLTGQVRFPEFAGEEWRELPVSAFAVRSSTKFDPHKQKDDFPCIELEHISQESGQILDTVSAKGQQSIKNQFHAGQVLFGKLRPYLRKYAQPPFDGVCSSEIWVLSGKLDICTNDYLFYLVQTTDFIAAANATSGTKMPRADWEHLSQAYFMLPPLTEQNKIVQLMRTCDDEIVLQQQKLAALRQQKKGLMQQLLTGHVRVNLEGVDVA